MSQCGDATGGLTLIDQLRTSLRPPLGIPARFVWIGNPGGVSHVQCYRRFIVGTTPWVPRIDGKTGRRFLWCPSAVADNPTIDRADYASQLKAAYCDDPAILAARLHGKWDVAAGGAFADVLDEERCATEPWSKIPEHYGEPWEAWLAYDHGTAAPAICHLLVRSPGALTDRRTLLPARLDHRVVDELAVCDPEDITKGAGWPALDATDAVGALTDREIRENFAQLSDHQRANDLAKPRVRDALLRSPFDSIYQQQAAGLWKQQVERTHAEELGKLDAIAEVAEWLDSAAGAMRNALAATDKELGDPGPTAADIAAAMRKSA
jgi:hypothetical protein